MIFIPVFDPLKTDIIKTESEPIMHKNKYQKCEYCDRMVEEIKKHIYNCKSRRMIEIKRIQIKQENERRNKDFSNTPKETKKFMFPYFNLKNKWTICDFYKKKVENNKRSSFIYRKPKQTIEIYPKNLKKDEQILKCNNLYDQDSFDFFNINNHIRESPLKINNNNNNYYYSKESKTPQIKSKKF